jgi:hypothetical protein
VLMCVVPRHWVALGCAVDTVWASPRAPIEVQCRTWVKCSFAWVSVSFGNVTCFSKRLSRVMMNTAFRRSRRTESQVPNLLFLARSCNLSMTSQLCHRSLFLKLSCFRTCAQTSYAEVCVPYCSPAGTFRNIRRIRMHGADDLTPYGVLAHAGSYISPLSVTLSEQCSCLPSLTLSLQQGWLFLAILADLATS